MGYRSDVGIALGFKTKDECDAFIMAYKLKEPEVWKEMIVGLWDRADERVLIGRYEDVKWYRGYDDVDAVHDMLEWAVENHDAMFRFIRVGEDYDDVAVEMDGGEDWGGDQSVFLDDYVDFHRAVDTATGTPID
jgi:hypothetical protein